jgi:hypothetical protein
MPKFKLLSKYAWGMKSNEWLQNLSDPNFASYGYAAPTVGDIDNDGNVEVIIGGHQNILRVYHIEGHEVTDSLIADENILFQTYQGDTNYYSAGGRLKPTVGNLVGDSAQELILGNIRGGLVFGSHIVSSTTNIQREKITKSTHLSVFPNPVKIGDRLQIVSPDKTFSWVVILRDVSGKTIATNHINTGEKAISISSENLSNGVYFIELQNFEHSKSHYAKFITTE